MKVKFIILSIIAIIILLCVDTFALTEYSDIAKGLSLVCGIISLILTVVFYKRFPSALRKFAVYFGLLLLISIFSSYVIYNQSIARGVITNAPILIGFSALLIYVLMDRYNIKKEELISAILTTSWITFIAFTFLFLTDYSYVNKLGNEFEFDSLRKGIINLGALIYLVRYFRTSHLKFFFFSVLLFSINHWFDFQRYIFFTYIISIGVLLLIYRKKKTGIRFLTIILFVFPMLLVGISNTEFGSEFIKKYSQVISFIEESDEDVDDSINARVIESDIAIKSIQSYPLTGIGNLGTELKEQVTKTNYFYVTDIGLLGVLYTYGILGILIYFAQWKYFVSAMRDKNWENLEFTLIIFFFLVYSIITGKTLHSPIELLLMIAFLEIEKQRILSFENQ